jgi:hypothetical protein
MAMLSEIFVFLHSSSQMAAYVLDQKTTAFFHILSNTSLNKRCTIGAIVVIKWSKNQLETSVNLCCSDVEPTIMVPGTTISNKI